MKRILCILVSLAFTSLTIIVGVLVIQTSQLLQWSLILLFPVSVVFLVSLIPLRDAITNPSLK